MNQLLLGDCLAVLKEMEDNSVALALVSPDVLDDVARTEAAKAFNTKS